MLDTVRFYNGQTSPFKERFTYTKPDTNWKEENGTAYLYINANPETFFTVPFEVETGEGTWRISVHKEITERFGSKGIVRVDPNIKEAIEANPDDPRYLFMAFDEASARIKGKALWRGYLRSVIEEFEKENEKRVTERGQNRLRPANWIAHAYEELGLEIPGDERFIKAGLQKDDVSELQATVKHQAEQIEQLLKLHTPPPVAVVAAGASSTAQSEQKQPEQTDEPDEQEQEAETVSASSGKEHTKKEKAKK